MRNVSFRQILILLIIFFFLFGDFFSFKKKLNNFIKYINNYIFNKNRKKGT